MQHYTDFARKHGVALNDTGPCQFCGARTARGVHECLEIFNFGFPTLDVSQPEHHRHKFFIVDAHTLQHSEIHDRWNNHFHLTRLHLILTHHVQWTYQRSPQLSDCFKAYKKNHPDAYLTPPPPLHRGALTTTDILAAPTQDTTTALIAQWAAQVYEAWSIHHDAVDPIATDYLNRHGA